MWELFAEEGEMKMYKREEEVDGLVVDPLKAIHQVSGVTAKELCHFFFIPGIVPTVVAELRSRSRWSRNYLRPGAGAEIIFLINIYCSQFK